MLAGVRGDELEMERLSKIFTQERIKQASELRRIYELSDWNQDQIRQVQSEMDRLTNRTLFNFEGDSLSFSQDLNARLIGPSVAHK